MCDISFIIPNYNGESLIPKCLESIYRLGMDEDRFEIIIIDDCSTDDSVKVIKGIACCHPNLILLQQPVNNRQGAARNRGLDIASGEYITFVDSDDLVGGDFVEALDEAINIKPDIFCGISKDFKDNNPEDGKIFKIISNLPLDTVYSGYDFFSKVQDFCGNNGTPWGYLFRRDYVEEYCKRFVEGHFFEETEWVNFYFLKAKTVLYSSKVIYYYYHNPLSVMSVNMGINYVADSNALGCRLMRLAEEFKHTDQDLFFAYNHYIDKNLLSRGIRFRFLMKYKPADIREFYKELGPEDLKYLKIHYKGNKGREFFYRHKYTSILVFSVLCSIRAIYRKILRRGPELVNFYYC